MKRSTYFFCGIAVTAFAVAMIAGILGIQRYRSYSDLLTLPADTVEISWIRHDGEQLAEPPTFWQALFGRAKMSFLAVHVVPDVEKTARTLRRARFIPVESLVLPIGYPDRSALLLQLIGEHRNVRELYMFAGDVDDRVASALATFPAVEQMALSGTMTGETLPRLERLRSLDVRYCPVTDQGFKNLISLPSIDELFLTYLDMTAPGLLQLLKQETSLTLVSIEFDGSNLDKTEINALQEAVERIALEWDGKLDALIPAN